MLGRFYKDHSVIGVLLRLIKFLTTFTIVSSIIIFSLLVIMYFYFAYDLPAIQTLKDYKPPVVSEVFADDGTKIGEFWKECRFWLKINEIPKELANAFIASEDARFFEHRGVDMFGVFRAVIENVKAGHVVQGGSTITQQITRSILLSSERKVARKIREAILATRIERNLKKEQILELYLNQIFLGNRAYGVAAAARNYFNKTVNELTLAEIAIIAGMPTAPSVDSPVHSIENAKERQEHVLSKMQEHGFIARDQKKAALLEPMKIYAAGTDKDFNYKYAPYFTEEVRRILLEKYGEDIIYEGGLKIYTTASLAMNQAAQIALRNGLEVLDKRQGYRGVLGHTDNIEDIADDKGKDDKFNKAVITGFEENTIKIMVGKKSGVIPRDGYKWARSFNTAWAAYDGADYLHDPRTKFKVGDIIQVKPSEKDGEFALAQRPLVEGAIYSMNPHSGEVKAIVGGYDFASSEFNRATQAVRQPGSSFKPFTYSAALDKGFRFSTPILDAPIVYQVGPYQPPWSPKNYDAKHRGLTTFENNLIHSRNIPTVKIANDVGLHYLTAYIRKMGLTSPIDKYLSMALGSNGVYLSEMVAAYSTFASGGIRPRPVIITKITGRDGNVLEEYLPPAETTESAPEKITDNEGLNTSLFEEAKGYIESDRLVLSREELKVLYGEVIPEGHVITPQTAYLMTKLLMGVVDRGTGTRVKALGKPVAGKTGTTNDETDCWFIGFVSDLAAGVWIGFDSIAKIGSKETGGKTAAPIFLEYIKEATKNMEAKNFKPPDGIKDEKVASLTGGSAVYFKGYSLLRSGLESEHRFSDRAIDFFEEDMAPAENKNEEDFEY